MKELVHTPDGDFIQDGGGIYVKCSDVKIASGMNNWMTRLWFIRRYPEKKVIISTYSLPKLEKQVERLIGLREEGQGIFLLCNSKFVWKAEKLKNMFPKLTVFLRQDVHAKIVLVEPDIVWEGSSNFGYSGWFENSIRLKSRTAFNYEYQRILRYLDIPEFSSKYSDL